MIATDIDQFTLVITMNIVGNMNSIYNTYSYSHDRITIRCVTDTVRFYRSKLIHFTTY